MVRLQEDYTDPYASAQSTYHDRDCLRGAKYDADTVQALTRVTPAPARISPVRVSSEHVRPERFWDCWRMMGPASSTPDELTGRAAGIVAPTDTIIPSKTGKRSPATAESVLSALPIHRVCCLAL